MLTHVGRLVSRSLFIAAGVCVTVGTMVILVHIGNPVGVDAGLNLMIAGNLAATLGAVVVIATRTRPGHNQRTRRPGPDTPTNPSP